MRPETVEILLSDQQLAKELRYVGLTGGEPSLCHFVPKITDILICRCPSLEEISYNTNGLEQQRVEDHITSILEILKETTIRLNVYLSLDGLHGVHDAIRGIEGAYRKANETLEMLKNLSQEGRLFGVAVNSVISRKNATSIPEFFYAMSAQGVQLNLSLAMETDTCIDSLASEEPFVIAEEQRKTLVPFLKRLRRIERLVGTTSLSYSYIDHLIDMLAGQTRKIPCPFAFRGGLIDPVGDVYACGKSTRLLYGNIKHSIYTGLKKRFYEIPSNTKIQTELCRHCESNCFLHINYEE